MPIGDNRGMERVTGIGGVFFRAHDPKALGAWYADHLGISLEDHSHSLFTAEAGDATVWSPFSGTPSTSGVRTSSGWSTSASATSTRC